MKEMSDEEVTMENKTQIIHELKTWPKYFQEVFMGHKTFEFRKNDRGFKIGDMLILNEWCPEKKEFTGRSLARVVTYILHDCDIYGIEDGYVILSIQ